MRHQQFNSLVNRLAVFALGAVLALLSVFGAGAQQQQGDKSKAAQTKEEEPVAITPKVVAEKTIEAPRTPTPEEFANFRFPIINNKSEIAFLALFNNPNGFNGSGQSVFIRQPDGKWKFMREGEKAVNLPEGIYGFSMPSFNDGGDLSFFSSFGSPTAARTTVTAPVDPNDPVSHAAPPRSAALYVRTAQGLKSLVRLGDEVPNMPSHFSGFSNPTTNAKGTTAFIGTYSDPDGRALFFVEEGKLRLIVRSGQKVGDTNPGETFSEHYYPTPINDRGEIAFLSRIGGDSSGIFIYRPSGLEQIAFTGKPSPIKGANYLGFGNRTPSMNSKGEVAFVAFYDGPNFGRGLFFKGAGPVQIVAKSGDKAGDTGGEFKDFLSPAVNARGDIAFIGKMEGRAQGIFVKTAKGIETVALLDQKIPGGKGEFEVFNNFTQPSINDKGEVVFYGQIKNSDVGIFYRDEKGVLHTLVKRGDKMPK
ncbi:MAG TPA: hypothetical protein PLD20_03455 [Blastocatellia bacterium]|nr:hypothetical protein [Blastocatellia bacterium]HMV82737.1 hypothetical protein [Blastocatellia bacterium]HMX27059.1 hypothetical protein [Blastocatellia bacterium]HMY70987.1 hypothetical protein [Blastocatellia bacterium]HMZ16959.1 hypothetical protein [Blastocatellia bacterium]